MSQAPANVNRLCVILARGGSKGLPRKNVLDLSGKPLLAWSIEAALSSHLFSKVIVSSDSAEILSVAADFGATPLRRPDELSSDSASSWDGVAHALDAERRNGLEYDICCLLQPTSPLRTAEHIQEALRKLERSTADAVMSVTQVKDHPAKVFRISEGALHSYLPGTLPTRRQDLESLYSENGAVYAFRVAAVAEATLRRCGLREAQTVPYVMSRTASVDIDDVIDFDFAAYLMRRPADDVSK